MQQNSEPSYPIPKSNTQKKVGDTEYHFLSWEGVGGGQWLKEDFSRFWVKKGSLCQLHVNMYTVETECNTRKSQDKRTRAHTAGLFVAVRKSFLHAVAILHGPPNL